MPARTVRAAVPDAEFLQAVTVEANGPQAPVAVPCRLLVPWEERTGPAVTAGAAAAYATALGTLRDLQAVPLLGLLEWARSLPEEQLRWPFNPTIPQFWTYATAVAVRERLDRSPIPVNSTNLSEIRDWDVLDLVDAVSYDSQSQHEPRWGVGAGFLAVLKVALDAAGVHDLPAPELSGLPDATTSAQRAFSPLAAIISQWRLGDLLHPGPAPEPPRSALGAVGVRSPAELAAASKRIPRLSAVQQQAAASSDDLSTEREQALAMRRWRSGQPLPDTLVPGDVSWLRTHHLGTIFPPPPYIDAVPYFIPTGGTQMLETEPPAPDLAQNLLMPHDNMLVVWADPLELSVDETLACSTWLLQRPDAWALSNPWQLRLTHSCHLVGVQLVADPSTRRPAEVLLIAAKQTRTLGWSGQGGTVGFELGLQAIAAPDWQTSDLAGLIDNILALVDYSLWDEPEPVAIAEEGKARRKALRSSAVRKMLLRGGGIAKMRVMALGRTAEKQARTTGSGQRKQPARPHLRRGHWRRQRVGPHDAWWYETRYIGPTIVNADLLGEGEQPRGRTIWMVPKQRTQS